MNRVLLGLSIAGALAAGCGAGEAPADSESAAYQVLGDHLQAMAEGDWERVYALTADEARPTNRSRWLERRQGREGGFVHRCVGQPTGRPVIDLETLEREADAFLVQAIVWVEPDRGTLCRWRVIEEDDGWRVGEHVERNALAGDH
jgi:hypothetical protein